MKTKITMVCLLIVFSAQLAFAQTSGTGKPVLFLQNQIPNKKVVCALCGGTFLLMTLSGAGAYLLNRVNEEKFAKDLSTAGVGSKALALMAAFWFQDGFSRLRDCVGSQLFTPDLQVYRGN